MRKNHARIKSTRKANQNDKYLSAPGTAELPKSISGEN
jgi:hypothetical protein